jgi:hypothetical protein
MPLPDWVRSHLREEPDDDPGHEGEWERAHRDAARDYLGHVIRLSPAPDAGNTEPGPPGGWLAHERRKPAACPMGIPLPSAEPA